MPKPLDGVKVLDMTRVLAGPYCTMMLGDMGADVIKIEPPYGDESRAIGVKVENDSGFYIGINRNKRSLALDLKADNTKAAAKVGPVAYARTRPSALSTRSAAGTTSSTMPKARSR